MMQRYPKKVISGGQTGVDQVALEVACACRIPTGGTVPKGWRTDAGPNPGLAAFGCVEHHSHTYRARTAKNVYDATGTVVFGNHLSPGCQLTINLCASYDRPCILNPTAAMLREWLDTNYIAVLNVAGNRRSTHPEAAHYAQVVLTETFGA